MSVLAKVLFLSLCVNEIKRFVAIDISCRDQNNNTVDWFIMYKIPELSESPIKWIREGYGFYYMDSGKIQWQLSQVPLNDTNHPLYYTMQQIYDNIQSQDQVFAFYNDETPEKHIASENGHTKGVINFNRQGGFWLVHSLPRFPDLKGYYWPPSGRRYGQTFLCISMKYSQLDLIGKQFWYTYPKIYNASFPEQFLKENPNMAKVITSKYRVQHEPWQNMLQLNSSAGQPFFSFAKYTHFDADIFDAWLAPYFKSDMFTETWQNGGHKTMSNCSASYEVENICNIRIDQVDFNETQDHSKWGVTLVNKWICIGGINRMEAQKKRAGGMVCANIPQVWQAFNSSISTVEVCPTKYLKKVRENSVLRMRFS